MSLSDANWDWVGVRSRSEALFGSPHRLQVFLLASIADTDELYAARIATEAKIKNMEATRELVHLEQAELLIKSGAITKPPRGRPGQLLTRRDQSAWDALQALGAKYRRAPPKTVRTR